MVEKNAVTGENIVRFTVVHDDPVAIDLRYGVWGARIKWRSLGLRNLLHLAVQLAGGGLVETRLHAGFLDRVEEAQRTDGIDLGGVLRHFEGHLHMTLRGKVVHFVRIDFLQQAVEIARIRQVAIMEKERFIVDIRIIVQVIDTAGVK